MLGIHRTLEQKEFLKSCKGFLRAALIGHSQPGPYRKIAKMAKLDRALFSMIQYCKITVCLTKITIRVHEIFIFKQFIWKFSSKLSKTKAQMIFLWDITYLFCFKLFNLTQKKYIFFHTFSYLQHFLEATVQFWFWKGKWLFWPWNQRNKNKCTSSYFFSFVILLSLFEINWALLEIPLHATYVYVLCNDFDSVYCTVYLPTSKVGH